MTYVICQISCVLYGISDGVCRISIQFGRWLGGLL